jgi:hypothetical protein
MMTEQQRFLHELRTKKGAPAAGEVESTEHTGYAYITNNWGIDIATVTIRHRRGNDPTKEESASYSVLRNGAKTPSPLSFTYETGLFSSYDYWWVSFLTADAKSYNIKDNFYCSVSSDDDGNVQFSLDGGGQEVNVSFSSSGGCTVSTIYLGPICPCS